MKTSIRNKKGFTIVELVIVIAVIAILAAVLIPTFANLVEKANLSADEQAVRQMNTALKIYEAENGKPSSAGEAKTALYTNGINSDTINPVTQGYAFYWDPDENIVVLVGPDKAKAEKDWQLLSSTGYGVEPDNKVINAETLKAAITKSSTSGTVLVVLDQDITFGSSETPTSPYDGAKAGLFNIGEGQSLILDLNGHTITSELTDANLFRVDDGGQLIVKNGNVNTKFCAFRNGNSTLAIEHVTVNNTGSNAVVHIAGISDTSITYATLTNSGGFVIATNSDKDEDDGSRIYISYSEIESTATDFCAINITTYSNITIESSTVKGDHHGAYLRGCNATIKDSTFTHVASTGDAWSTGNHGPVADIVFASGGNEFTSYCATVTYKCSNVTASTVIVHEPEGGTVNLSGITETHRCHLGYNETCTDGHN